MRIINAVAVAGAVLLGVVLSGTYLGYWNPPLFSVDEGASGVPAAVLCLILGAMSWVMQRKEPNALIGLRTRWTLRSNLSWARSHRFAGQSSPVAAAVLILPELLGVRLPGSILFPPKASRSPGALLLLRPGDSLRQDGSVGAWIVEDGYVARPVRVLPLRPRLLRSRAGRPPAHAVTGAGAPLNDGGGPAPVSCGTRRNCSAAALATSCSRFALCSIFSQRALFLRAVCAA